MGTSGGSSFWDASRIDVMLTCYLIHKWEIVAWWDGDRIII